MQDILDDYIRKNITKYRLNKKIKDWYLANKWILVFFFIFPLVMDLIFRTFSTFSLVKSVMILLIEAFWIYLKYFFIKTVLVEKKIVFSTWKYNLVNALIWGLIITFLAIPSEELNYVAGNFFINLIVVYIFGGLFSLLFTGLEVPRIKAYLHETKKKS